MARKKKEEDDPTITSEVSTEVEGVHPARPPTEQAYSPERFVYKDNPDKPHPTTVAQIVLDPLRDEV